MQQVELDIKIGKVCYPMVKVTAGRFIMGGQESEMSEHEEVISKSYFIGKFPITQEMWYEVMKEHSNNKYIGKYKPVDEVSFDESIAFINKLNELTGMIFDLPTESQWEYAAKGVSLSKEFTLSESNNPEEVMGKNEIGEAYQTVTYDIGLFNPNEIGLYDMTNNLSEWCKSKILKGGLLGYEGGIIWNHCSCAQQLPDYCADCYTPNKGLRLVLNL